MQLWGYSVMRVQCRSSAMRSRRLLPRSRTSTGISGSWPWRTGPPPSLSSADGTRADARLQPSADQRALLMFLQQQADRSRKAV